MSEEETKLRSAFEHLLNARRGMPNATELDIATRIIGMALFDAAGALATQVERIERRHKTAVDARDVYR